MPVTNIQESAGIENNIVLCHSKGDLLSISDALEWGLGYEVTILCHRQYHISNFTAVHAGQ